MTDTGDDSTSVNDPTLNHPIVREEIKTPARSADKSMADLENASDKDKIGAFQRLKNWAQGIVMPRSQVDVLGERGENIAAKHLRNAGFKIIERNFRCQVGEIDIIARDGKTLVFVEVKTRAYDDNDVTPEDQVNTHKRHQITKAAKYYLTRYGWPQPPSRFDVVAIVWPTGREPMIRHTTDAFESTF